METNTSPVHILLVEDNPGDARLIKELLSEAGTITFDMETVTLLSNGIEALAAGKFDMVLLDLGLPDSSGLDTLLRSLDAALHTAIIVLTGIDDDDLALKAVQKGAQDYLVKGQITPDLLSRAIRYAFERKRADRKNAELKSRLLQCRKMEAIGTMAGGIAHSFNNILFPIIGHTEMMIDDVPENSELRMHLDSVLKSALRARDLIRQILTFSRHLPCELTLMRIQPVLKECLSLSRSILPGTIDIRQNIRNDCSMIMADPAQIHQMIMSVITNAYHAMGETGGQLNVDLTTTMLEPDDVMGLDIKPGKYARVTIEDNGTGMEKSVSERIFDPYFTTKEQGKGIGLDLAVVYGIIRNCRGDIRVYSEPGKGTVFHIYLPVVKSQEKKVEAEEEAARGGHEHILLVDDDANIAKMEKKMLERLGYQVTARNSSIEAFETFCAAPDKFDLVITDMTMPHITGVMLSEKILEIKPDIPIIICTGFSSQINEEKAKLMGIREFFLKPIIRRKLAHTIRQALGDKKA